MICEPDSRGQQLTTSHSGGSTRHVVNSLIDRSPSTFLEITRSTAPTAQANPPGLAPLLFWKALAGLLVFDVLGFGSNFARMHQFVGSWRLSERRVSGESVDQICKAINYACVWYPKQVLCLQRSAVTTCLMRDAGIPATMVLGAQTLPFKAHAWTEVNGCPVNERRDVQSVYAIWERC